ncbi:MAG: orotidine-5'-phosphate decarboxylase [Gammaproteobacteria bacterium]|nr:MAG: orotidine-5'-phosphate decarboxylase [Gammaproteobacteria bacterium]PIE37280.1 MAG: orotidine-5'-phosphate decarboxylase [Gammaproteobacteria bacterium]
MVRIITALDLASEEEAHRLIEKLDPALTRLKVGKQLFTSAGPAIVRYCQDAGFDVFLDLKFHDIPTTVAKALEAAAAMGVWMVNVHASGGPNMLAAARRAVDAAEWQTQLIGVTALTSLDASQLAAIGLHEEPEDTVRRLTTLCVDAGLDGVVCSPHEVPLIRELAPRGFLCVTPGVRIEDGVVTSHGGGADDQRRIMGPAAAIAAGADHLVIGRPITQAQDPLAALRAIVDSLPA